MRRNLSFIAVSFFALVFCAPGRAQDSPSLGDLARQAQKNKTNTPAKKVLTTDDISTGSSSGSGLGSTGLGSVAAPAAPAASGTPSAPPSPQQATGQMEALINKIAALSRTELVQGALQGMDVDFPGRKEWEQRMVSAQQTYVARGRELLQRAEQIQASAESLKGIQDPNDRRVRDFTNRMKALVQDGTSLDAAFQAVILEGRDLAGHAMSQ
jgi:hypothetical protein